MEKLAHHPRTPNVRIQKLGGNPPSGMGANDDIPQPARLLLTILLRACQVDPFRPFQGLLGQGLPGPNPPCSFQDQVVWPKPLDSSRGLRVVYLTFPSNGPSLIYDFQLEAVVRGTPVRDLSGL